MRGGEHDNDCECTLGAGGGDWGHDLGCGYVVDSGGGGMMASKGRASWMLEYPDNPRYSRYKGEWTGQRNCGEGKSHWRKFLNLCRVLKQTGAQYDVEYIDMATHLRAFVRWVA